MSSDEYRARRSIEPDDWADGDRRRGGVSRAQAFTWNCRNQPPDAKGEAQAEPGERRGRGAPWAVMMTAPARRARSP